MHSNDEPQFLCTMEIRKKKEEKNGKCRKKFAAYKEIEMIQRNKN